MPSIKLFPAMVLVGSALAVPVQQPTVNTCIVDGTDYTKNAFDVVKDIALATSLCPNDLSINEFYKLLQKCCDDLNKIGKGTGVDDGSVLGGYLSGIPESVGGDDGVSVGVPGNVQDGTPASVSVGDSVGVPSTGNEGLSTHIGTPAGASLGGGRDTLGLGLGASGSSGGKGVGVPSAGIPGVDAPVSVPSVEAPGVDTPSVGIPSVGVPSVGNGGTGLDVGTPTGSGGLLSGLGIGKDTLGLGLDGSTSNGSPLDLGVGTLGLGLGGTGSSGLGLGGLGDSLNIPDALGAVDGAVPSLGGILSSPSSPSTGVSVPLTGAVDGAAPSVGGISVPSGSNTLPGSSPSTGSGDCIENLCESLNGLKNTLVNKLTDCDGACYDQLSGSLLGWKKSTPDSDCKNNAPEGTKSTCSGTSDDGESICVYSTLNSAWWASKVDKTKVGVTDAWCCST